MPFMIQCSKCGGAEDLRDDKLAVPFEWSVVTVKTYSKSQVNDTLELGHLCPSCSPGSFKRAISDT